MSRTLYILFLILIGHFSNAQLVFQGVGGSYSGMAFSGLTYEGRSSAALNPALLPFQDRNVAGFGVWQPYSLSNLVTVYGYGAFRMGNGFGGLHLIYNGQGSFNRTGTRFYYALPLTEGLSAFAEGGYWFSRRRTDGSQLSGFTSRFGMTGKWNGWSISANAINPVRQTNENVSDLLFLYGGAFGVGYSPNEKFWAGVDVYLMENRNPEWRYGISYFIVEQFGVRGGISPELDIWSIGIGIRWDDWAADLGYATHQVLGQSPEITISYVF